MTKNFIFAIMAAITFVSAEGFATVQSCDCTCQKIGGPSSCPAYRDIPDGTTDTKAFCKGLNGGTCGGNGWGVLTGCTPGGGAGRSFSSLRSSDSGVCYKDAKAADAAIKLEQNSAQ